MLIKKNWCHCHMCRHSDYNHRTKKYFTRGSNGYKDSKHKQRVRRLRKAKLNKDLELIFDKTVGYTD